MDKKIHIAGIGGVGMSALAQALLDRGERLSGSDRLLDKGDCTATLETLRRQGVELFAQDGSGVDERTSCLVVSSAVEADNADVQRAEALGIPVVHRAASLAQTLKGHKLCAVSGTCGKSTVTAMLGHLLAETGFDPVVVNGAGIAGWDADGARIAAVRPGKGEWAVAEVDESDKSLMVFEPDAVIVTNASSDHFGVDEANELFDAFLAKARGAVVDGRSGTIEFTPDGFVLEGVEYSVPVPGTHNILNASLAVRMALALGAEAQALVKALASFKGVERRLQERGLCNGARVFDDYAHNPEKLAAAWSTLQQMAPRGVVGVWRPHGYAPLRKMMGALAEMFATVLRDCDELLLLPVYDAGGSAQRDVDSDMLRRAIAEKGCAGVRTVLPEEVECVMREAAEEGRVLAVFGARDPELPRLAARLAR